MPAQRAFSDDAVLQVGFGVDSVFVRPSVHTTVAIACWNMASTLRSAVVSALSSLGHDFEIVVLDDGSTDGSLETLRDIRDPRIRRVQNQTHRGLTESRNELLASAAGKYVSILDADDIFSPLKIRRHAALLDEDHRRGVVYGKSLLLTVGGEKLRLIPAGPVGWDLLGSIGVAHSATTWRKSVLEAVGGYEKKYELIECAHMFLKVGDIAEQYFSNSLDCLVRRDEKGILRRKAKTEEIKISRACFWEAVRRRQGFENRRWVCRLM